jgi:hypothetical protein
MPKDTREPQSYGSGSDWVTGRTGQEVNDQDATPPPEHSDFYDSSREAQTTPNQGGLTSDFQLAESAEPTGRPTGDDSPISKVTTQPGGAKRGSFFRKRDYE